jgi:hypothetical protein
MDAHRSKRPLLGRIDQKSFLFSGDVTEIDTALFLSAIPTPIKVSGSYSCRLINNFNIEILPHTAFDRLKSWAVSKIVLTSLLLFVDPRLGLREGAIFEPSVRVHNCYSMDEVSHRLEYCRC